jgi:hypothetical protein
MLFVSHALQASSAFAEAVANAYIDYYQFVCTCCPGNSKAISIVSADVEVPLHLVCWTTVTRQSGGGCTYDWIGTTALGLQQTSPC